MKQLGRLWRMIWFEKMFGLWQLFGFHLTRNYYYSPIPDTRDLTKRVEKIWREKEEIPGLKINSTTQLNFLEQICQTFKAEYDRLPKRPTGRIDQFYLKNGSFEEVDAEVYYAIIRHFKPAKIVEIGAGMSTLLAALALAKNEQESGQKSSLTAFEPYPREFLTNNSRIRLEKKRVETVPLEEFTRLGPNDILFIDSSHVVRIGNDVIREILEILPRLPSGVLIHFHDIFLPDEYPKKWVLSEKRFFAEQYLLRAFLSFNDQFEIIWAGNFTRLKYPEKLKRYFASFNPAEKKEIGSFWLRRK